MAEFIQKTDTLNEGREKLNVAIQDAEDAKTTAGQAVDVSEQAKQIAQAAEDKADSTQTQLDTIVIEGDSSVEAAQARVDASGNPYTTLKERLDTEHTQITQQLAENASNIVDIKKVYGAKGNGVDSDVQAIIQGSRNNNKLGFPNGVYVVDSNILIENESFEWIALGDNVVILDKCKYITLEDNTKAKVPNGILLNGCENVAIKGIKLNANTSHGKVRVDKENERVPQLDFHNCRNVDIDIKVMNEVGAYVDRENIDAINFMRSSITRMVNCSNINFIGEALSGSGRGEIFSFYNCSFLDLDLQHIQGQSNTTFWSLANVINCKNVNFNRVKVESNSPGSLFDISGSDYIFKKVNIDYQYGKMLDITSEWGVSNVDTSNVIVGDVISNGSGIVTSTVEPFNKESIIDNVVIESMILNVPIEYANSEVTTIAVQTSNAKKVTVNNLVLNNISRIVHSLIVAEKLNFERVVNINNLNYRCESNFREHVYLDVAGLLNIENSYFESNTRHLVFHDRLSQYRGLNSLKSSPSIVNISNTVFKNCVIDVRANITFNNCVFDNVQFVEGTQSFVKNPSLIFNDCEFIFIDTNEAITKRGDWFDLPTSELIEINGGIIKGKTENTEGIALFGYVTNANINMYNTKIDLKRTTDGEVSDYSIFSFTRDRKPRNLKLKNIDFGTSYAITFAGQDDTSTTHNSLVTVINCYFERGNSVRANGTDNSKSSLILVNSALKSPNLTQLVNTSSTLNSFINEGNVEW